MRSTRARRLKELESENAKLKWFLADAMFDQAALRDILAKEMGALISKPVIGERTAIVSCRRRRPQEHA